MKKLTCKICKATFEVEDGVIEPVCPVCKATGGALEVVMTSVFSWQNSISLCPASFCTPRPNLPVTLGAS